jgi:acyl carrier protein
MSCKPASVWPGSGWSRGKKGNFACPDAGRAGSLLAMVMAATLEASEALGSPIAWTLVAAALVFGGIFFIVAIVKAFTRQTTGWILAAVVSGVVALIGLFGAISMSAKAATRLVQAKKEQDARKKRSAPVSRKLNPAPEQAAGDVQGRIRSIVVEQLGLKPEQVTREARFIEDLGADSLDLVELVMATEEEFEISIPDEEAERIRTIGELLRYVEEQAAAARGE